MNEHPAVRAAAPRFALFDAHTDIPFPGGIHQTWFTQKWADGNLPIDTNTITDKFGLRVRLMVRGIRPVDADEDRFKLMKSGHAPTLTFYRNRVYASAIELPEAPR